MIIKTWKDNSKYLLNQNKSTLVDGNIPANPKADKKKLQLLSHSSLSLVSLTIVGSSLIVTCLSKLFLTSSFFVSLSSKSDTFLESAKNKSVQKSSHRFCIKEASLALQGKRAKDNIFFFNMMIRLNCKTLCVVCSN